MTTSDFENMPICTPNPDGTCSICADEGIEARVIEVRDHQMALVQMPNGEQEVAIDLIDNVQVNDTLLIHLGFAIARLREHA